MSDQQMTPREALSSEITSSLASVWQHYAAERPANAKTTIEGNLIRTIFIDAVPAFDDGMAAAADEPDPDRPLTPTTYRRDAIAAVTKATKRRVVTFLSDHKTATANELFILDDAPGARSN